MVIKSEKLGQTNILMCHELISSNYRGDREKWGALINWSHTISAEQEGLNDTCREIHVYAFVQD